LAWCRTEPLEHGLKNERFPKVNLGDKGLRVRITTEGEGDAETVTQIRTLGGKGGK
jgi:hypothetical protein